MVLPFGGEAFDFNVINADGLTIMKRAIEWAIGSYELTSVRITVQQGPDATAAISTTTEILNRPRVTGA